MKISETTSLALPGGARRSPTMGWTTPQAPAHKNAVNDEEDEILIHVRAEKLLSCAMDSESAVHSGDEQVLHFISSLAFPFGKHGGVLRVGQRYWGRRRRAHLHTPRQDLS